MTHSYGSKLGGVKLRRQLLLHALARYGPGKAHSSISPPVMSFHLLRTAPQLLRP